MCRNGLSDPKITVKNFCGCGRVRWKDTCISHDPQWPALITNNLHVIILSICLASLPISLLAPPWFECICIVIHHMQHTMGKRGPFDRKGMNVLVIQTLTLQERNKWRVFCRPHHPKTTLIDFKRKKNFFNFQERSVSSQNYRASC